MVFSRLVINLTCYRHDLVKKGRGIFSTCYRLDLLLIDLVIIRRGISRIVIDSNCYRLDLVIIRRGIFSTCYRLDFLKTRIGKNTTGYISTW